MRNTEWTVTGGTIDNPGIEILRDDLVGLLYAAAADDREYLFGDSITGVDEGDDSVLVTLEHGRPRAFDIVIGADGLHSNVRRLAIGSESRFIKRMRRYVAICSMPNFLELDYWQTCCSPLSGQAPAWHWSVPMCWRGSWPLPMVTMAGGLRTTRREFLTTCAAISRWRLTRTPETRRSRTTFATRS
jgi:2-polyprenyl-6-methoxyphenol hydroxylase-like FAD-dependent oxidoreductase